MQEEQNMKQIINRIKNRRNELMLSYQDLADKTGMSKSTLQRYETGSIKNMPLDKLGILAKALNVSPAYLMGWEDTKEDKILTNNTLSKKEITLLSNYNKLNDIGKNEAEKRVEELTYINKYIENDEICAAVAEEKEDYLMPIAAHDDDLTDEEKEEMNRRIEEILKKRNRK